MEDAIVAGIIFGVAGLVLRILRDRSGRWMGALVALISLLLFAAAASIFLPMGLGGAKSLTGEAGAKRVLSIFSLLVLTILYGSIWIGFLGDLLGSNGPRPSRRTRPSYDLARRAEEKGDLLEALMLYKREAEAFPGDPYPLDRMAELYCQRGAYREAVYALRATRDLHRNKQAWIDRTLEISDLLLTRLGQMAEAERELRILLDRYPRGPHVQRAQSMMRRMT